jgi:hypothetical protein
MEVKEIIENTILNVHVFVENFQELVPVNQKKNITISLADCDIKFFENSNNVKDRLDEIDEVSFSIMLLNSNNNSVIMVDIYHNGYRYKSTIGGAFSEIYEVLSDNIGNLYKKHIDVLSKDETRIIH